MARQSVSGGRHRLRRRRLVKHADVGVLLWLIELFYQWQSVPGNLNVFAAANPAGTLFDIVMTEKRFPGPPWIQPDETEA